MKLALGETEKRCIFKLVRCKFCYEIIGRVIDFFLKPNDPERNKKQKRAKIENTRKIPKLAVLSLSLQNRLQNRMIACFTKHNQHIEALRTLK